jgi:DNA-binding NarL/FixJ family response regulator
MFHTLIAEDNATFRLALREMLTRRFPFMDIEEASDGTQALDQAKAGHHDLVFMDIKMPGINGLDVTRAIKSDDRDAIICVVTAYDLPEYRDAAHDSGADHFIVKDESTEAVVVALVEAILSRRLKALIIEDDDSFRSLLHEMLTLQWPEMIVAEAGDGPEALREAARLMPDLLLLDLDLPTGNGLDLLHPISAAQGPPVIVIITGYDRPEYRDAAARYGVRHYVTKDSSISDELRKVVGEILAKSVQTFHWPRLSSGDQGLIHADSATILLPLSSAKRTK